MCIKVNSEKYMFISVHFRKYGNEEVRGCMTRTLTLLALTSWYGMNRYHNLRAIPFLWICMSEHVCVPGRLPTLHRKSISCLVFVFVCAYLGHGKVIQHVLVLHSNDNAHSHSDWVQTFCVFIDFYRDFIDIRSIQCLSHFQHFQPDVRTDYGKMTFGVNRKTTANMITCEFRHQAIACQLRTSISVCRTGMAVYCVTVSWAAWMHRTKTITKWNTEQILITDS